MKIRTVILSSLAGMMVLFFAYESSLARSKAKPTVVEPSLKIGVVNVRRIFQDSDRNSRYRQQATAERDKVIAELEMLSRGIEAEKAGLKALKEESDEYMTKVKEILQKQAGLQAQQEFYKQQMELKDQRWTEKIYEDILRETVEVAKQKKLDLVFEKDEVELPAPSANELMLTVRTHKLLYSGGCVDITEEVMARLDGAKSKE